MLLGGDEFGRSQQGNNNAWCQDNELSWFDWEGVDLDLCRLRPPADPLRQTEPVFRRREFLVGEQATGSELPDVLWLRPDGERDDRRGLGPRGCPCARRVPKRHGDPQPRP